jgi:hypothetical protein
MTKELDEEWQGEERREARRRYTIDRRTFERRKKYWSSLLMPIIVGLIATSIVTWGAYVTHVTYGISAKYEETFVRHVAEQLKKDAEVDRRLNMIRSDYSNQMDRLRDDMNAGFKDLRDFQHDIYSIQAKGRLDLREKVEQEVEEEAE